MLRKIIVVMSVCLFVFSNAIAEMKPLAKNNNKGDNAESIKENGPITICSDAVHYDSKTGDVVYTGNVLVIQVKDVIVGCNKPLPKEEQKTKDAKDSLENLENKESEVLDKETTKESKLVQVKESLEQEGEKEKLTADEQKESKNSKEFNFVKNTSENHLKEEDKDSVKKEDYQESADSLDSVDKNVQDEYVTAAERIAAERAKNKKDEVDAKKKAIEEGKSIKKFDFLTPDESLSYSDNQENWLKSAKKLCLQKQGCRFLAGEILTINIEPKSGDVNTMVSRSDNGEMSKFYAYPYPEKEGKKDSIESPVEGYGEKVRYFVKENKAELENNAVISQNGNEFRGNKINYNLTTDIVDVPKNKKKRSSMLLSNVPEMHL